MIFNKIEIPAYGPFTGLEIDLPKNGGDFHLIYGPNEAGKSSLLRALRALLFGIPAQTKDVFLHHGPQMRIIAELEKLDGAAGIFQRRKGNKNTLLDGLEAAIPEAELKDFLGGVDEAYFDSMFGLGSDELRMGADALLRGEGKLGEALFSASLGGTPVDKVIQSLEAEAGRLFRGRAGSSIRGSRKQLDECLKLSKESIIKPEAWDEVEKAIEQKTGQRGKLSLERQELFNRKSWLERCRDALPMVGQLRECLRQLAELPEMPELSESFGEDIKQARATWHGEENQIHPTEIQITGLRSQADGCQLAPEVLTDEAEIDRLHTGIGVYRDQTLNLTKKRAEAEQGKIRLEIACRDLEISTPFADLETRRISQVIFLEAEQTARTTAAAAEALNSAQKTAEALHKELKELGNQRTLSDAGDIKALEQAEEETKKFEDVANGMDVRISAAMVLRKKIEGLRSQLPGSPEVLEQIHKLEIPLKSSIERFRDGFDELKRKDADLEKRRSEEQAKADKVTAEIDRFSRQRDLPSLEDLTSSRSHRDHGWCLVLADWKGGGAKEEFAAGTPLEEAYPNAVAAADTVADRLRTDAEDVAQREEKRLQLVTSGMALAEILKQQERLAEDRSGLEAKWKNAWEPCNLEPLSPREMAEWRASWEDFRRQWDQWSADTEKISQDQDDVTRAVAILKAVLSISDDHLLALLSAARTKIAKHNQAVGADGEVVRQITRKEQELQEITGKLPEMQAAAAIAQTAWISFRAALSLPEALHPEKAVALLRSRKEMFVEYDHWCLLTNDAKDLETRTAAHEAAISRLVSRLKLESRGAESDAAALWKLLESAKKSQSRVEDLQNQIRDKETDLEAIRQQAKQASEAFGAMLLTTSLKNEEALDGFLQHFEARKKIDDRLRTLRDSLAGIARNETVEDFRKRVEQENSAEIDGSLTTIDGRIAELGTEIETLRTELQEFTTRRKAMEEASDESAKQAQLAELATARLHQDSERFVRLQVAITMLKSRIDRFREQNQGPLMEKASRWFSEITGAAFSGITTSYDAGDQPVIAGQRSDETANRTVPIGGMSEGTRDQLFLALRLAGLELHLADHEPMPLILDDLLVHFDDERALRALTALRSFGQRSQVLLFTHHAHVVQLAESHWGKNGFHLHQLSSSSKTVASV